MIQHHWEGKSPNMKMFGFIYLVTNKTNGRKYIGKKQYQFTKTSSIKGKKRTVKTGVPSGWEFYTGSSKWLNEDIKKHGIGEFKFEILWNCSSRSMLYWMEVKEQVTRNVLLERLEGSDLPLYYNRQIAGVKFIPKGEAL